MWISNLGIKKLLGHHTFYFDLNYSRLPRQFLYPSVRTYSVLNLFIQLFILIHILLYWEERRWGILVRSELVALSHCSI